MSRRHVLSLVLFVTLSACGTSRAYAPSYDVGEMGAVGVQSEADAAFVRGGLSAEVSYERTQTESRERKLIRTASLDVAVRNKEEVALAIDQARALAADQDGYVASERSGTITLRIPDPQLDATLDALADLGREIRRDVQTSDVTMQYADLEIRLANAQAFQARLRTLLDRAETVQDVLAVESELSRVTVEVERLEGQIRFLSNQVAYSTVVFRAHEAVKPGPLGYVVVGAYEAVKWLFVRG